MLKGITTRSPGLMCSTPEPTASTTPIGSWPRMSPSSRNGPSTSYMCRAEPQMPLEVTRTIASVSCSIVGSGTVSTRTSRLPCHVNALIASPPSRSMAVPVPPAPPGETCSPPEQGLDRERVHNGRGRCPAPPRGVHRVGHAPEPGGGGGVATARDPHPGGKPLADVVGRQVEPAREPVHLARDAGLEGHLERALEVEGVLRPVADDAAGGVAQAARGGVMHGVDDPGGQVVAAGPLAGVDR